MYIYQVRESEWNYFVHPEIFRAVQKGSCALCSTSFSWSIGSFPPTVDTAAPNDGARDMYKYH